MMVSVVQNGTGTNGRRSTAYEVGGKTGTAQNGPSTARPRLVHRLRAARTASRSRSRCHAEHGGHSGGSHRRPGRGAGREGRHAGGQLMSGASEVDMISPGHDARRPLPPGRADRQRWHGRRLARRRRGAGPYGRGEDPAAGAVGGAGLRRAVPRRGAHHGDHQPPGRGRHLRLRQRPARSGAYLVMEYVEGDALSRTLARVGRLTPARTMALVAAGAPTRCTPRTRRASCTAT